MFARISTLEGTSKDDTMEHVNAHVLPKLRKIDGFRGLVALVDRDRGRSVAITLWASGEAMAASEAAADQLRTDAAVVAGERITSVDRYEVAVLDLEA